MRVDCVEETAAVQDLYSARVPVDETLSLGAAATGGRPRGAQTPSYRWLLM